MESVLIQTKLQGKCLCVNGSKIGEETLTIRKKLLTIHSQGFFFKEFIEMFQDCQLRAHNVNYVAFKGPTEFHQIFNCFTKLRDNNKLYFYWIGY